MKSISVHGIDEETEKLILERARKRGMSVNKVVKELITESLGLDPSGRGRDNSAAFADLCGVWTQEEAERLLESLSGLGFDSVEESEWR